MLQVRIQSSPAVIIISLHSLTGYATSEDTILASGDRHSLTGYATVVFNIVDNTFSTGD